MKIVPITRKNVLCDGCESLKAKHRFIYSNSRDFLDYCDNCMTKLKVVAMAYQQEASHVTSNAQ